MRIVIVIVNYRTADLTIDCLRSLAPEIGDDPQIKVVVTDNASGDGSIDRIATAIEDNRWTFASTQPLPRNGGFAYGNNEAIKLHRDAKYILLLNPDTVVHPGAIRELEKFMDANPIVGIAGSRLEDPDGTGQISAFRFPGILSELEQGMRFGPLSRLLAKWVVAQPIFAGESRCDWVAGASMIVRRDVFETVGLMDEKFFMYYEEVDFCLAASRAGVSCWYVPTSRVIHLVGAASQLSDSRKHRKRRPTYWFDSRRRYFVKNHGFIYAAMVDLAFVLGYSIFRMRRLLQRKPDTDPPRFLLDSICNSVIVKGGPE